jgi:hypothetical protein
MNTRTYHDLFRYLMEKSCQLQEDIEFVDDISAWCRERGLDEADKDKPFKLVKKEGGGCLMLVRTSLPESVIEERLRAMSMRAQVRNVASDRSATLDTDHKRLAFLFLNEYARSLPEIDGDDLMADDWAFDSMDRLGYFKADADSSGLPG